MTRIYETKIEHNGDQLTYSVLIKRPDGTTVEEPVSRELHEELQSLQRELWKIDKREQRHCVHLDAIPEGYLPRHRDEDDPEESLLAQQRAIDASLAFEQLPLKQQRRIMLRHIYDLPISRIADIEHCSERAVKYSLKLAKKNLIDILGKDYMRGW